MDDTDLAILREMFPDHVWHQGGLDPRISAAQIAGILGISHTAVLKRIRGWSRSGLWDGYTAFPNASLFGLELTGQLIQSRSPKARLAVLALLPSLPGVVHVWEQEEGNLWLAYLGKGIRKAADGARVIAAVPKVRVVVPHHRFPMPEWDGRLTATDWRILQAVRADPSARPRTIAHRLGVSLRTVRRRLDRLIDSKALLFLPRLDHTRAPGALTSVNVELTRSADVPEIWRRIHREVRVVLPLGYWGSTNLVWDLVPDVPSLSRFLLFFMLLPSPAEVTRVVVALEEVPGVDAVAATFPHKVWDLPTAYDLAIASALEPRSPR